MPVVLAWCSNYLGIGPIGCNQGSFFGPDPELDCMTTFDEREDAFERQFAHDEDLKFKAEARRNKLLGLWVADKLGKSGPEADTYAKEVVVADFEAPNHAGVLRKVLGDFGAKGITLTERDIRAKMSELLATAVAQVKS